MTESVRERGLSREHLRKRNRRAPVERRAKSVNARPRTGNAWAPVLAFLSVGSLALVVGLPSYAATETPVTAPLPSTETDQRVTASRTQQSVMRDSVGAVMARGTPGGRTLATYVNNPNGVIQWPFVGTVPISDLFGAREAPCSGCSTMHQGIDFDPGEGSPVQIIADGVVTKVNLLDDNGEGVFVEIAHDVAGLKFTSRYCHLLSGSVLVSEGQAVTVTQALAQVGNTGTSTGAHMHFEIHVDGTAVDPFAWLTSHAN